MNVPPPVLEGVLTDFALADALQLLELGSRSGVLVVDGGPLGAGRVLLGRGRVTAVVTRDGGRAADVATAVADLLELPRGRWTFYAVEAAAAAPDEGSSGSGTASIGAILVEAARRRDERARVAAADAVNDADVVAVRLGDGSGDAVGQLTAAHLRVFGVVDGDRDVRGMAAALRWDVARVRTHVEALRAHGLVEVARVRVCVGDLA